MEAITNNPGLSFLALDIFEDLDIDTVLNCRQVCKEWQGLIDSQFESKKSWKTLIQRFHGLKKMKFQHYSDELFIEKFPNWIRLLKYFQTQESLYNLKTFVSFMENYFEDSNTRLSESPLHYAAVKGNLDVMRIFIKSPLDFNSKDVHGHTALHLACENRHTKILKLILNHSEEKGIDMNIASVGGWTPLHRACYMGNTEFLKILLENHQSKDIDLNATDDFDRTPIHLACAYEEFKIVELLVKNADKGIDLEAKDDEGRTPLMLAQEKGYVDIAELFQ